MGNPLSLNAEELDVIRGLQEGAQLAEAGDPIWESLEDLGLVEARDDERLGHDAYAYPSAHAGGSDYPAD